MLRIQFIEKGVVREVDADLNTIEEHYREMEFAQFAEAYLHPIFEQLFPVGEVPNAS
jgi:hypothetical protein